MLRNSSDGREQLVHIIEALEHDALAQVLRAAHGRRLLFLDLKAVELLIDADDFDLSRCGDLHKAMFDIESDDTAYAYQVWISAIKLVRSTLQLEEETLADAPPQSEARLACTCVQETPYSANSDSIEHATRILVPGIRLVLRDELEGKLVLDHPDFERVYFGGTSGLSDMVERAYLAGQDGDEPLYTGQHRCGRAWMRTTRPPLWRGSAACSKAFEALSRRTLGRRIATASFIFPTRPCAAHRPSRNSTFPLSSAGRNRHHHHHPPTPRPALQQRGPSCCCSASIRSGPRNSKRCCKWPGIRGKSSAPSPGPPLRPRLQPARSHGALVHVRPQRRRCVG